MPHQLALVGGARDQVNEPEHAPQRYSPEGTGFDDRDAGHVILDDVRAIFAFDQFLDVSLYVEIRRRRLMGLCPAQHDDPDDGERNQ